MSSFPPPDVALGVPEAIHLVDVFIVAVGIIHTEPDVEILARSGDVFYRFNLPKHARVVRDYWKNIGVINTSKLQEGCYQDERGGCGPYDLDGTLIGEDVPVDEEDAQIVLSDEPAEPDRVDKLLSFLDDAKVPVEEPDVSEVEEDVVVTVGTKVLVGVTMKSTKPAPSGLIRTGGHVLKGSANVR